MQLLFLLACFHHRNELPCFMKDTVPVLTAKLANPLQEIA